MEAKFNEKVHIMNHPLVAHKLTIMRDENTSVKDFRHTKLAGHGGAL